MLKYIKKKHCHWQREEMQMQQQRIPLLLTPELEEKLKNEKIENIQAKFYPITYDLKPASPEDNIKFWIENELLVDYAEMQAALFPSKYKNARDYILKECTAGGKHDFTLTTLDD